MDHSRTQKALPPSHKQIIDKCSGRKRQPSQQQGFLAVTQAQPTICRKAVPSSKRKGASHGGEPSGLRDSDTGRCHLVPMRRPSVPLPQTPSETEKLVSTHPSNAVPFSALQGTYFPASKPTPLATYPG